MNLEGALTWAFEFEDQPPFAGFRALASDGIDLPVLNAFRMFSQMGGQQLAVESDSEVPLDSILRAGVRARPDVSALASLASNRLCVLVWHYHDDDTAGPAAAVKLALDGLPAKIEKAQLRHFRIDDGHSDAFTVWQRMGSPLTLSAEQVHGTGKGRATGRTGTVENHPHQQPPDGFEIPFAAGSGIVAGHRVDQPLSEAVDSAQNVSRHDSCRRRPG